MTADEIGTVGECVAFSLAQLGMLFPAGTRLTLVVRPPGGAAVVITEDDRSAVARVLTGGVRCAGAVLVGDERSAA
jgi:archaellin